MPAIRSRVRARLFAAGLIALWGAAPAALFAQQDSAAEAAEAAAEAAAIAHADSIRAALVQPPGSKSSPAAAIVRAPFRLFAGALGVVAGVGFGAYKLLDHFGAIDAVLDTNRELESVDLEVRPDFIANRSGVGVSARWDGSGTPLFLEGGWSIRGYQLARGGLAFGDTLYGAEVGAGWQKLTQVHFWGIGPDAPASARSDYAFARRDVTGELRTRLLPHVRLTVNGGWEEFRAQEPNDAARPDLLDSFAGDLPFGALGIERFARVQGVLDVDFTSIGSSDRLRGVRALGTWSGHRGVSETDAEFQIATGDLRLYLPVTRHQELALRGLATETFGEEGDGISLYHLPRLGSTDGLRGQKGWRYRDRAVLSGMAEWRYQVWWHPGDPQYRLDAFVFADHGAVGSSLGAIESGDFVTTPGIGLRFLEHGETQAETFLAFGGDKTRGGIKLRASF